jgi:hypothetical protein
MPYAPPEQYPHFYHHPPGPIYGAASSGYDDVPPSGTPVNEKGDEARSSTIDPASLPQASFSDPRDAIDIQGQFLEDVEVREDSCKLLDWRECDDDNKNLQD